MDAHFLSEAVKDNISDSVNEMIRLFQTLAPANNQIYTDALDRLVAAQAPQRNQIDAAAEEFTFAIPQHTYETMIATVPAIEYGGSIRKTFKSTFFIRF